MTAVNRRLTPSTSQLQGCTDRSTLPRCEDYAACILNFKVRSDRFRRRSQLSFQRLISRKSQHFKPVFKAPASYEPGLEPLSNLIAFASPHVPVSCKSPTKNKLRLAIKLSASFRIGQ